jgi:phosphatidylinositol 4-kinase B
LAGWQLLSVIVKADADLRQEKLALQLVHEMGAIFAECNVPVFVKSYRLLIACNGNGGLMETLTDMLLIHSIKKEALIMGRRSRQGEVEGGLLQQAGAAYSLLDYFVDMYGEPGSESFEIARQHFLASLVGYSLVTYLLAVKDRHNGNILVDKDGHLIHIDYGFMLSNSPGYVGFESAPFKLTQDYVAILGGPQSPLFQIDFKRLLLAAFLAVRKHADRILLMADIMRKGTKLSAYIIVFLLLAALLYYIYIYIYIVWAIAFLLSSLFFSIDSKLACFYSGEAAMQHLRERFQLGMTEDQVKEYIDRLITASYCNLFTRLYDAFQYYANGIL